MGIKDLFRKKKNTSDKSGANIGKSIGSVNKTKVFTKQTNNFKDEDFMKEIEERDVQSLISLNTLNTLNQTQLKNNHMSLSTNNKLDTLDTLSVTDIDKEEEDLLDLYESNKNKNKSKLIEDEERELLKLYNEENEEEGNKEPSFDNDEDILNLYKEDKTPELNDTELLNLSNDDNSAIEKEEKFDFNVSDEESEILNFYKENNTEDNNELAKKEASFNVSDEESDILNSYKENNTEEKDLLNFAEDKDNYVESLKENVGDLLSSDNISEEENTSKKIEKEETKGFFKKKKNKSFKEESTTEFLNLKEKEFNDFVKEEDFYKKELEKEDDLIINNDITKTNGVDIQSLRSLENELVNNFNTKSYTKDEYSKQSIKFKNKLLLLGSTFLIGFGAIGSSLHLIYSSKDKEVEAIKSSFILYGQSKDISQYFNKLRNGDTDSEKTLNSLLEKSSEDFKKLNDNMKSFNNTDLNEQLNNLEKYLQNLKENMTNNQVLYKLDKQHNSLKIEVKMHEDSMKAIIQNIYKSYQKAEQKPNQAELEKVLSLEQSLINMTDSIYNVLNGINIDENIQELNKERTNFKNILLEIAKGDEKEGIRNIFLFPEVVTDYNNLATKWKNILLTFNKVLEAKPNIQKVININKENEGLIQKISDTFENLNTILSGKNINNINIYLYVLIAGLLSIISSSILLFLAYKQDRKIKEDRLLTEAEENKDSIEKLVNELVYLRDGDLTKRTTVSEGITSDVADAINATMDSLSAVVKKIQASSILVNKKTNHINKLADNLLNSTEIQSESIVDVSKSIYKIANEISAISEKTKLSLNTANNSKQASKLGLETVKDSVKSMSVINNNMEETVVLMKKVSDSSRQISEVISLLSDITEETNILALNATVQAAKAGEAGKGFKVVADAIQELADNAADATRRVGTLIATVQTDIHSVSLSINKTTNEVHKGVGLSENVGSQLNEIAKISNELAELIKSVSIDTSSNAETAIQLTENMKNILDLTEKTKDSTKDTNKAISEIEKVSSELSQSVKSFIVN